MAQAPRCRCSWRQSCWSTPKPSCFGSIQKEAEERPTAPQDRSLLPQGSGAQAHRQQRHLSYSSSISHQTDAERAWGRNSKGDSFAVETTKVFTEQEHPELGRVFRAAPGDDRQKFAAVRDYLKRQFDDGDILMEESAQTWEYQERSDDDMSRLRGRSGIESAISTQR